MNHESVYEMFSLHEAKDVHESIAVSLSLVGEIIETTTRIIEDDNLSLQTNEREAVNLVEAGFAYFCSLATFIALLKAEGVEKDDFALGIDSFYLAASKVFLERNISINDVEKFTEDNGFLECALFSGEKMAEAILSERQGRKQ